MIGRSPGDILIFFCLLVCVVFGRLLHFFVRQFSPCWGILHHIVDGLGSIHNNHHNDTGLLGLSFPCLCQSKLRVYAWAATTAQLLCSNLLCGGNVTWLKEGDLK